MGKFGLYIFFFILKLDDLFFYFVIFFHTFYELSLGFGLLFFENFILFLKDLS